MNLLENFVNKFSLEQKTSTTTFNFNDSLSINDNNNNRLNILAKSHHQNNTKIIQNSPKCFNFHHHNIYMDNIINNNDSNSGCVAFSSTFQGGQGELIVYDDDDCIQQSNINSTAATTTTTSNTTSSSTNNNNQNSLKKGMRNMFSFNQIEILENIFEQTHYPDSTMREKLSAHLGINSSRIQVWFQNRRAKFRKFDMKNKKCGGKFVNQRKNQQELMSFTSANFENDNSNHVRNTTNDILESSSANNNNSYTQPPTSSSSSQLNSSSYYHPEALIINSNSYANYLKTPFAPIPMSSSPLQNDELLVSNYFNNQNEQIHSNYGYHAFATTTNDRIQTLYPNQIYAHYQGDDNY